MVISSRAFCVLSDDIQQFAAATRSAAIAEARVIFNSCKVASTAMSLRTSTVHPVRALKSLFQSAILLLAPFQLPYRASSFKPASDGMNACEPAPANPPEGPRLIVAVSGEAQIGYSRAALGPTARPALFACLDQHLAEGLGPSVCYECSLSPEALYTQSCVVEQPANEIYRTPYASTVICS